jgi:hypothetical protein
MAALATIAASIARNLPQLWEGERALHARDGNERGSWLPVLR